MWISKKRLDEMLMGTQELAFQRAKSYFDQSESVRRAARLSEEMRIKEEIFSLALVPPTGFGVGISAARAITAFMKFLQVDFSVPSSEVLITKKGGPEQPEVHPSNDESSFIFTGDHFVSSSALRKGAGAGSVPPSS